MNTTRSFLAASIAILLSACGDDTATFTPLGTTAPEPLTSIETVVEDVEVVAQKPVVINDLPCMITVRGDLPEAIAKFDNACGVTVIRQCDDIGMGMYRCSNQPPQVTALPRFGEVPEIAIPEEVIVEPEVEPEVDSVEVPVEEPEEIDEVAEVVIPEVVVEPVAEVIVPAPKAPAVPPVATKKPVVAPKPKPRPIPRPTNTDASSVYVERHDLAIDYDDVSEGSVVTFGKLWAHVILNLGGDVWVAGHSDNIAAVLEYVATFYPDVNTRNIKVVTVTTEHDVNTRSYKIIDQYATLLEVDDHDDIDVTIAANSIAAVSHNDGKLVVPDDLYPIGP